MREALGLILLALLIGAVVISALWFWQRKQAEREFRRGHSDYSRFRRGDP